MHNIKELNETRLRLAERVRHLGMMNSPSDPDESLKQAAQYHLAQEAWRQADHEFQQAVQGMSAKELEALLD